jgi:hypothetical protein
LGGHGGQGFQIRREVGTKQPGKFLLRTIDVQKKKTTEAYHQAIEIERESADMREATRQQKRRTKKELAAQKERQRGALLYYN